MRKQSSKIGPDFPNNKGKNKFFAFYKTHPERALVGFLKDIAKSEVNRKKLSSFLAKRNRVNCLIMGCSHWANPKDTANFLKSFNKNLDTNVVVLDVLPDALLESIERGVDCLPIVAPAQKTPFLNKYFDVIVCDCLLTCCSFDQHEPIIKELSRVISKTGLLLLGIVHSEKNITFRMDERPIMNYCRPLNNYKNLFGKYNFIFPRGAFVETRLPGKWNKMKIANGIVLNNKK